LFCNAFSPLVSNLLLLACLLRKKKERRTKERKKKSLVTFFFFFSFLFVGAAIEFFQKLAYHCDFLFVSVQGLIHS